MENPVLCRTLMLIWRARVRGLGFCCVQGKCDTLCSLLTSSFSISFGLRLSLLFAVQRKSPSFSEETAASTARKALILLRQRAPTSSRVQIHGKGTKCRCTRQSLCPGLCHATDMVSNLMRVTLNRCVHRVTSFAFMLGTYGRCGRSLRLANIATLFHCGVNKCAQVIMSIAASNDRGYAQVSASRCFAPHGTEQKSRRYSKRNSHCQLSPPIERPRVPMTQPCLIIATAAANQPTKISSTV